MPFKVSSRVATPFILFGLGFFALHCSSDEGSPTNTGGSGTQPTSGSGGVPAGGSSAGVSGGGMSTGGSSAGNSTTAGAAGTGSPGGSGGAGGSSAGAGGSGGGSAGNGGSGGSGGSGGGGNGVTFAQVKELLSKSCAGGKCHDMASQQMDWITADTLYDNLTKPIPAGIPHCEGTVPVVPGNPEMSFLLTAVKGPGKVTCKKGNGTEMIARMPDDCPQANRPCLTDVQIKLIEDWIKGGAPK